MTADDRFDRTLPAWLRDDAAHRVTDHLDEVLRVTATTRQRPAWSSLERWLPVDTTLRPRLFNLPSAGRLVLVAALILALVGLLIFAVGSRQQRLPAPFGPARNGIFVTSRDGDLFTVDPSTASGSPLVLGSAFDFSPAFSRDGTKFVFLRSDGPLTDPAILTLMVADADGTSPHAVTPPTKSLDWFDWSPDGKNVAYVAAGQLWVADVMGGQAVRLKDSGPAHFPTWLPPGGREIIYRLETTVPAIFAIAPDGASKRRPISKTPGNNRFDYESIAVSPDGSHVTFTRWFDKDPDGKPYPQQVGWLPRVFSLEVATGTEVELPTVRGMGQRGAAVYSPDGTQVAYARIHREGAFEIVVANADGSGNERAIGDKKPGPPDGSSIDASWAFTPDGRALLIRYGTDDRSTTRLVPLDGSPSTDLGSGGLSFVDVQRLAP
jgi:Tol biopolymer transport system component